MKCCVNIACALRWEVASVGFFSIGSGSPYIGKTFQVLDIHRRTARIRGREGEESRFVAL